MSENLTGILLTHTVHAGEGVCPVHSTPMSDQAEED